MRASYFLLCPMRRICDKMPGKAIKPGENGVKRKQFAIDRIEFPDSNQLNRWRDSLETGNKGQLPHNLTENAANIVLTKVEDTLPIHGRLPAFMLARNCRYSSAHCFGLSIIGK